MSELKIRPFEEQLRDAIILNRIDQAEKAATENGIKEGIEKTIPRFLETMTPEEISEEFDIELERVLEIKNSLE